MNCPDTSAGKALSPIAAGGTFATRDHWEKGNKVFATSYTFLCGRFQPIHKANETLGRTAAINIGDC